MDAVGYGSEAIEKVRTAILGTEIVNVVLGRLVQRVTADDGPIALAVADGDLASLGAPWPEYHDFAARLARELRADQQMFWKGQARLLSAHRFHTSEARALFPHQATNAVVGQPLLEPCARQETSQLAGTSGSRLANWLYDRDRGTDSRSSSWEEVSQKTRDRFMDEARRALAHAGVQID